MKCISERARPAFALVEMVAVIAILTMLTALGVRLLSGTGAHARRSATDRLAGWIEQARTEAVTSRHYTVLAVAEPVDLPANDPVCRLGLFKVADWPGSPLDVISAVRMSRWRALEPGVVLLGGGLDGLVNPLDAPQLALAVGSDGTPTIHFHAIAFNPRGGLLYPAGSSPVILRVAEGNYRNGSPQPYHHGNPQITSENLLKIGRVTGRPYRIDR